MIKNISSDVGWKKRAMEAERLLIEHRVNCAAAHAKADRINAWLHDECKRPASAHFVFGPERDIALMIEWLLTKYTKKP